MISLTDGTKVLQPTSIDKLTPDQMFSASDSEIMRDHASDMLIDYFDPGPFMRRLGFTKNPFVCDHTRQRYTTRWRCADCGMDL